MGGQTKRVLIGRFPVISADAARQTGLGFALEWGRGAGKTIQIGAPTVEAAMEAYLARPRLRSETHKVGLRQQFELHLKDWLGLSLDEISKSMVVEAWRVVHAAAISCEFLKGTINVPRRMGPSGPFHRLLLDLFEFYELTEDPVNIAKSWRKHVGTKLLINL